VPKWKNAKGNQGKNNNCAIIFQVRRGANFLETGAIPDLNKVLKNLFSTISLEATPYELFVKYRDIFQQFSHKVNCSLQFFIDLSIELPKTYNSETVLLAAFQLTAKYHKLDANILHLNCNENIKNQCYESLEELAFNSLLQNPDLVNCAIVYKG